MLQKFFSLFILLLIFFSPLLAQQGQRNISGTITDAESEEPLPYATVSVHKSSDSSLITGTATDENGRFTIKVFPGKQYLRISFLSFKEKFLNLPEKGDANLKTIVLEPSTAMMEEVIVEGKKSQMQFNLDKRVFNVASDITVQGLNVSEILDNLPSVEVDVEGNVSLRNSQNVRILINGKPSGFLSTADALRQLQGDMVERIEIITNPSAKQEAEGEAGIINIVLKKNERQGFNGSFELRAGYPSNLGASANLNYRRYWVNLFANYGISLRENPGSGYTFQEFYLPDSQYTTIRERNMLRGGLSQNIRTGADFFLDKNNTITTSFLYSFSDEKNVTNLLYRDFDINNNPVNLTERSDHEVEDEQDFEMALNYERKFDQKDRLLTASLQYIDSRELEKSNLEEETIGSGNRIFQRSANDEHWNNLLGQVDYEHPFSEDTKLEAGLRSTVRNIKNAYLVENWETTEWATLDSLSNTLHYSEIIHAAYATYGSKYKDFSYQLGLRAEYSDITVELEGANEPISKKYINFFPSAHFTYEFSKDRSLQWSYSRRLSRPHFRSLNPFYSFSDSRAFYGGNPDLDPEFTHSVEMGYLKYWKKASFYGGIYYRHTDGVIQRVTRVDDNGITYTQPVNLSERDAAGLETNFSTQILPWWKINGNFNFFREITGGNYMGEKLYSDTYGWSSRATSRITIKKKLDWQTSFMYRSPQQRPQGRSLALYFLDMGLSMDVLKKNGTLTLSGRDLLNTRRWRSITSGDNFYSENDFQWRARQVILTFSYRINQGKKRGGKPAGGNGYQGDDGDM